MLWASSVKSAEPRVAFIRAAVLEVCDKHSFSQSCYFLCRNATCEVHLEERVFMYDTCMKSSSERKIRHKSQVVTVTDRLVI